MQRKPNVSTECDYKIRTSIIIIILDKTFSFAMSVHPKVYNVVFNTRLHFWIVHYLRKIDVWFKTPNESNLWGHL